MPPLDFLAAALTMASTPLIAHKKRIGWLILASGAALWCAVGLTEPLWGLVLSSLWTIWWSIQGWRRRKP